MSLMRQNKICYFTALTSDNHHPFAFCLASSEQPSCLPCSFSLHCYLISHDVEKIKDVVFEVTLYLKLHPEILSPLKFIYANKV